MAEYLEGGCACGEVRYRVAAPALFVHCCHCHECQVHTGSAFVLNAMIEASRVELLCGAPKAVAVPTESGNPHDIYRCPACRTAIWSDYGARRTMIFLRVGTLDDPAAMPPDVHIYTNRKLPWVALPADVPSFEEFYDWRSLWPAEARERRRALKR